jgi:hypothetical protein
MGRAGTAERERRAPDSPTPAAGRRLRARVTLTRDGNIHVEVVQPKGEAQPLIPSLQRHRCQIPTCLRWAYAGSLAGERSLGLAVGAYCGTCLEELILRCLEQHTGCRRPASSTAASAEPSETRASARRMIGTADSDSFASIAAARKCIGPRSVASAVAASRSRR